MQSTGKKRILSGMRPTGRLHIGHYVGALENWVRLQDEYENFHLIADYHSLTTDLDSAGVEANSREMVIDWLAAGIDPEKSPIFRQSQIKEHAELFLIFAMLVTKERLERNPTLKEQVRDLNMETIIYGHLGYPVLQAADILLYKGDAVPVGEDQAPHVEIAREIARKFNNTWERVFPEPEVMLTEFARLTGLDGKSKMSKSLGNTVLLSDTPEEIWNKTRKAVTDPQKVRRGDPGRPDVCTVFTYHKRFNAPELDDIRSGCESGALGCFDCKKNISAKMADFFAPMREKRAHYEANPQEVTEILADGERRARGEAQDTMRRVRAAMHFGELKENG